MQKEGNEKIPWKNKVNLKSRERKEGWVKDFPTGLSLFRLRSGRILAALKHLLLRGRLKIGCSSRLFRLERWMREQKATLI